MRCDSCGQESIHYNLAAEYRVGDEWRKGVVCWECQKRFAPAIREKSARQAPAQPVKGVA